MLAAHSAEVAALYPPELLDYPLTGEIISVNDVCGTQVYRSVWPGEERIPGVGSR